MARSTAASQIYYPSATQLAEVKPLASLSQPNENIAQLSETGPLVQHLIHRNSRIHVLSAPYELEWQAGQLASADAKAGKLFMEAKPPSRLGTSYTRSSSGIGVIFRPMEPSSTVRFSPYVRYDYNYGASAWFVRAHSTAHLCIYIQSWNNDGEDPRIEVDHRIELWSIHTGGTTSQRSFDYNILCPVDQSTIYARMTNERIYSAWIWGTVFAQRRYLILPFPPFFFMSNAWSRLVPRVPFFVIEEGIE